jgi:hypothetical protein
MSYLTGYDTTGWINNKQLIPSTTNSMVSSQGSTPSGGSFGGAGMASAAVGIAQSIGNAMVGYAQGKVAKAQADYNATLMRGKAQWIDFQKGVESAKWDRLRNRFISKGMNTIAGQGLRPTGSPMAAMLDSVTQINIDKAISLSNLEQEKLYTTNAAKMYENQGRMALSSARTNAYTEILKGVSNYAMTRYGA